MKARRASPDDAQAIAKVHAASWQVAYRGLLPRRGVGPSPGGRPPRPVLPRLQAGTLSVWVTEDAGRIAGFLSACPSRDADAQPLAFAEVAAL